MITKVIFPSERGDNMEIIVSLLEMAELEVLQVINEEQMVQILLLVD